MLFRVTLVFLERLYRSEIKYGAWSVLIDGKDQNVFFPNKDGCYGVPQMTLGQYRLRGDKTQRNLSMDCLDPLIVHWFVCLPSVNPQ